MGRGKSSAAIRYMNQNKGKKCFLYITPYLTEVDRVCELCDFDEPGCDYMSKSNMLKEMLRHKKNIASTHSLFDLMDDDALAIAHEQGYSLIVDESLQIIHSAAISPRDRDLLLEKFITVDEDTGLVKWIEDDYDGRFAIYMEMAKRGSLYYHSSSFFEVMPTSKLTSFDEVFMLTYLFGGQLQKAYLDFFGLEYEIVGVERDDRGYYFSDKPDDPPPLDYESLINIIDKDRMLRVGDDRTALSASWFKKRSQSDPEIKLLRNHLRNFMDRATGDIPGDRLWTTFKDCKEWLYGPHKRYAEKYLSLNARATNAYRDATCVAYLANRFVDPNFTKFFAMKDIKIDHNQFALSEMLQFIWRSAIRDGKEIYVYIPSLRMRTLLIQWIKSTNKGARK